MTNAETIIVLDKLIAVTELMSIEVADLVNDSASRVSREYVSGIRRHADEIREAGSELRKVFDTYLSPSDRSSLGGSK